MADQPSTRQDFLHFLKELDARVTDPGTRQDFLNALARFRDGTSDRRTMFKDVVRICSADKVNAALAAMRARTAENS